MCAPAKLSEVIILNHTTVAQSCDYTQASKETASCISWQSVAKVLKILCDSSDAISSDTISLLTLVTNNAATRFFDDTAPEPWKQRTAYHSNSHIHSAVINTEQPSARRAGSSSLLDKNLVSVEICCGFALFFRKDNQRREHCSTLG